MATTSPDHLDEDRLDDDLDGGELDDPSYAGGWTRGLSVALVVLGAVGLAAAFALAVDKYRILADPQVSLSCDLNPILSCGSVMTTEQAELFGFPNPLLGVIGFSVVVTVGLLSLSARLPRWVHGGLALGSLAGLTFVHWLAYQSAFVIGALCPWCMVVWSVTIPIAVWTTSSFLAGSRGILGRVGRGVWFWRYLVVLLWYAAFVTVALVQFWYFWRTLL